MDLGYYWSKKVFRVLKGVKMPIFYKNVYKTPYNGTKPGLMGNISFQARNSKIYILPFCAIGMDLLVQKGLSGS